MLNGKGIPLGRVLGVPIYLDWSWFLVFAFMTWSLATGYFPKQFTGGSLGQYWVAGAIATILLFVSVLIHELGHATVARAYHIPVQRITLFIFGGVAQLGAESRTAMSEFLVAIVGPIVSAALAGLFFVIGLAARATTPVDALFSLLAGINLSLALFNLIPGFPLDGGRVFRAIVWGITKDMSRATHIAVQVGRLVALGFVAFGVLQMLMGELSGGLWLAFIGWFLKQAADAQLRYQVMRDMLSDYTVSQAMSRSYSTVPAEMSLQNLIDKHILGQGQRSVVVEKSGHPEGLLTVHHIREIPREKWGEMTALQAMAPEDCCERVTPATRLWDALEKMDRNGYNQLLVTRNGDLVGMLNRGDVITFLRTVQDLAA